MNKPTNSHIERANALAGPIIVNGKRCFVGTKAMRKLKDATFGVWLGYHVCANAKGEAWPGNERLALIAQCDARNVTKARRRLIDAGLIEIVEPSRPGRPARVKLINPHPATNHDPLDDDIVDDDSVDDDIVDDESGGLSPTTSSVVPDDIVTQSPTTSSPNQLSINQSSTNQSTHSDASRERDGLDGLKLVWDTYPARRRGDWDEVARVWRELNLEGRGAEIAKRVDRYKSSDEWKVRKCVFGLVRFLRELRDVDPDDGTPDESDDEYALSPEQLADIDKVRTEMREEEERNGCDLGDALKVFGITSAGDSYNLRRAGGVHPIHVFAVGWQVQKESGVKTPAALILSRLRSGEIPKITAKFIADIEPKPRIGPKQVKGYQGQSIVMIDNTVHEESFIANNADLIRIVSWAKQFKPTKENCPPGHELRFRPDGGEAYHAPIKPAAQPIRDAGHAPWHPSRDESTPQPIGDVTAVDAELAARVDHIANAPIDELKAELTTDASPKRVPRPALSDLREAGAA